MTPGDGRSHLFRAEPNEPCRREGFVLALVLLALLLIAALVSGVFFAATEETRISAASAERQLALSAAESAIEMSIAGWRTDARRPVDIGTSRSSPLDGLGVPVTMRITRLDSTLYSINADIRGREPGAAVTRRIEVIVSVRIAADSSIRIDRIPERSWSELF